MESTRRIYASPSYEVYGLSRNPFIELASEGIEDIESIHVYQEVDMRISSLISDVIVQ